MYPTFNFFGREIGTYAICSIIGLFLCGLVSVTLSKKYRIGKNGKLDIFDISMIILVIAGGMFLGGHILYGLTHIREIILIFSYFPKLSWMDFFSQLGFHPEDKVSVQLFIYHTQNVHGGKIIRQLIPYYFDSNVVEMPEEVSG